MFTSVWFSAIIVIVAFALFFILSFKGYNLFAVVLFASALVCLTLPGMFSNLFTVFMPGVTGFASSQLLLYTMGGAYGYCLMESKLGSAVARHMIKVFGKKNIPLVIFLITCALVGAGVSSYQFAILAIALPLLKEADLPKKVALAAMSAGGGSIMWGIMAGVPSALNVAPTVFLGTTTLAGFGMSVACSVFAFIFCYLWFKHLLNNAEKNNEHFTAHPDDIINETDEELPPAWKGYICLASMVVLSLVFQFVFKQPAIYAVVYAAILSIVLCALLVGKKWLASPLKTSVKGFTTTLVPFMTIAFIIGYGSLVQSTAVFSFAVEKVMSLDIHPYLLTFIAVNLLAGMCANGIGGVNMYMSTIGQTLINNPAVNVGALHRISTIAACGFDSLPHNGAISFQLSVFKLSYKEGYFQQFMMSVVVNLLAGLLAVGIGILFY